MGVGCVGGGGDGGVVGVVVWRGIPDEPCPPLQNHPASLEGAF